MRRWFGWAALAAASCGTRHEGAGGEAPADAPRPLALVYSTSLQGEIEPCG